MFESVVEQMSGETDALVREVVDAQEEITRVCHIVVVMMALMVRQLTRREKELEESSRRLSETVGRLEQQVEAARTTELGLARDLAAANSTKQRLSTELAASNAALEVGILAVDSH